MSVALVAGCATTQQTERVAKIDPFESINRAVFTLSQNSEGGKIALCIAAFLGKTRLIDNIVI